MTSIKKLLMTDTNTIGSLGIGNIIRGGFLNPPISSSNKQTIPNVYSATSPVGPTFRGGNIYSVTSPTIGGNYIIGGNTPLHTLINDYSKSQNKKIYNEIANTIKNGADVNAQNDKGETPSILAGKLNLEDIVLLLHETGRVDYSLKDKQGWKVSLHMKIGQKVRKPADAIEQIPSSIVSAVKKVPSATVSAAKAVANEVSEVMTKEQISKFLYSPVKAVTNVTSDLFSTNIIKQTPEIKSPEQEQAVKPQESLLSDSNLTDSLKNLTKLIPVTASEVPKPPPVAPAPESAPEVPAPSKPASSASAATDVDVDRFISSIINTNKTQTQVGGASVVHGSRKMKSYSTSPENFFEVSGTSGAKEDSDSEESGEEIRRLLNNQVDQKHKEVLDYIKSALTKYGFKDGQESAIKSIIYRKVKDEHPEYNALERIEEVFKRAKGDAMEKISKEDVEKTLSSMEEHRKEKEKSMSERPAKPINAKPKKEKKPKVSKEDSSESESDAPKEKKTGRKKASKKKEESPASEASFVPLSELDLSESDDEEEWKL